MKKRDKIRYLSERLLNPDKITLVSKKGEDLIEELELLDLSTVKCNHLKYGRKAITVYLDKHQLDMIKSLIDLSLTEKSSSVSYFSVNRDIILYNLKNGTLFIMRLEDEGN